MRVYDPVAIARMFKYVREVAQNIGLRVEAIQRWGDGQPGESWCAYFVWFVFDICYQGLAPLPRTGSTRVMLAHCKSAGYVVATPAPGDIVFSVDPTTGEPHHVAICTAIGPLATIAGNTSSDGLSSNGDRVAEHNVSLTNKVLVRLPLTA